LLEDNASEGLESKLALASRGFPKPNLDLTTSPV
jgi:hypothetical protein